VEIVSFNSVNINFNNVSLVKNFNLQIFDGEFVMLKGNNGSGKTSIIKAILGEMDYTGLITINGQLLNKNTELFKTISYVSSTTSNNFVSGVVEDELKLPLIEQGYKKIYIQNRIDELLNYFNITHLKKCNISTLSGGEQQLVAVISAMLCNSKLLILDEALANLDYKLKLSTFNKIKNYLKSKHKSLLFITNENCFNGFDKVINLSSETDFTFSPLYSKTENVVKLIEAVNFNPLLKKKAINNPVNFSLYSGDTLALMGESGSGKSLLINALAGFEKYDGKLYFDESIKLEDIKIVFQNAENYLLKTTVLEELGRVKDADEYLNLIKLTNLESKLNLNIEKLSTGEKRILALTEVILTKPKILILDEIFSNLSTNSIKIVFELLKQFTSLGGALIIVEHNLDYAKLYANHILEIARPEKKIYIEKKVSLGKYIYKNTLIHKMPALIKIMFTITYIILTFLATKWWHFGALFGFYVLVSLLSLTNPLKLLKPTIPLWVFALFVFLLNSLTINFISGLKMFFRLGLLNLYVPILTITTSPFELLTAVPLKFVPFNFLKKFVFSLELIAVTSLLQVENGSMIARNAMRWQKNLGVNYKGAPLKIKTKNIGEVFVLLFRYLIINSKNVATSLYLKGAMYRWYIK